jgi:DivIVA domain-containing protein
MDQYERENRIADLERQLAELRAGGDPGGYGGSPQAAFPPPASGLSAVSTGLTPEDVRSVAFAKPALGRRGYNEDQVDAFLDLVEAALRDPTGRILTPELVRNVAFTKPARGKRGYNEDDVDAFLDLIEAQLSSQQGVMPPLPKSQQGVSPPLPKPFL